MTYFIKNIQHIVIMIQKYLAHFNNNTQIFITFSKNTQKISIFSRWLKKNIQFILTMIQKYMDKKYRDISMGHFNT